MPELEHGIEIAKAFSIFQTSLLSDTTLVGCYNCDQDGRRFRKQILDETQLAAILNPREQQRACCFYFINKYLIHDHNGPRPSDSNKLRISKDALRSLASYYNIPPAFVFALSRYYLPSGRGSRIFTNPSGQTSFDIWYILPIRVQVPCTENRTGADHPSSKSGNDQMNPFNYLHLPDSEVNVRGSCIAVISNLDINTSSFTYIVFNMMHGGWSKVVQEPQTRIAEAIQHSSGSSTQLGAGCFVHLIYLTSAARWWTNALHSVNEQLIAYERRLQEEMDSEQNTTESASTINRALHSIAAHLHRYRSELNSVEGIIADLSTHYTILCERGAKEDAEKASRGFRQVLTQIQATNHFAQELEKKVQNILALLFNRIQITSDRLLVNNGKAMQEILRATQEDAHISRQMADESRRLTEEMKKDSVAMKTIATVTMFFLPGASFAAVLAMPFFTGNEWLSQTSRLWVWLALTIPSTGLAFGFYFYWRRRDICRDE